MTKANYLDVTDGSEFKTISVSKCRFNSTLILDLTQRCYPSGERGDQLERSSLTLRYGPESRPQQEITIGGWDIAALLGGMEELRLPLLLRINDADRVNAATSTKTERPPRGRRKATAR